MIDVGHNFSDYQTLSHIHLKPDGSYARHRVDNRIAVPLEFITEFQHQDLDQGWHMISLIDPKDWKQQHELKWLSFEVSLQDADLKQAVSRYDSVFIADADVFSLSESLPLFHDLS